MNAVSANEARTLRELCSSEPAALLEALRCAYSDTEAAAAEMDALTRTAEPDMERLAGARFRIGSASLARRLLLNHALDELLRHAGPSDAQMIRSLQRECVAYGRASTEHIRNWPVDRIREEWSAYCEASRRIRGRMRHRLRVEQRTLFPLLVRYGAR